MAAFVFALTFLGFVSFKFLVGETGATTVPEFTAFLKASEIMYSID